MNYEKNHLNKVEEILSYLKEEINKKNRMISRLLKTKHGLKIAHTVASSFTIGSSTGGLVLTSTIVAIIPGFILESISLVTGFTTLLLMQFSGCILKKIGKNREILLLAINKQEEVFKIYV